MSGEVSIAEHELTHVEMRGPKGPRLTPACTCGWWSADGSHAAFERHLRAVVAVPAEDDKP